jgi:hypothetical protein
MKRFGTLFKKYGVYSLLVLSICHFLLGTFTSICFGWFFSIMFLIEYKDKIRKEVIEEMETKKNGVN